MIIRFTPILQDRALTLLRSGDVLIVNGEEFDFSIVPDGAVLPVEGIACDCFAGAVTRTTGVLTIPIRLPLKYGATEAARFPSPIVNPSNGPIALPE